MLENQHKFYYEAYAIQFSKIERSRASEAPNRLSAPRSTAVRLVTWKRFIWIPIAPVNPKNEKKRKKVKKTYFSLNIHKDTGFCCFFELSRDRINPYPVSAGPPTLNYDSFCAALQQ
uniref:Uncharacterized protein n=1 Tax=uncultured myxobacterium HF0070_11L13 TaxID=723554 RepID=E7C220_9BACT|nr:hypothetical protein [uncultured myxobacterium HF0070_11L13]